MKPLAVSPVTLVGWAAKPPVLVCWPTEKVVAPCAALGTYTPAVDWVAVPLTPLVLVMAGALTPTTGGQVGQGTWAERLRDTRVKKIALFMVLSLRVRGAGLYAYEHPGRG